MGGLGDGRAAGGARLAALGGAFGLQAVLGAHRSGPDRLHGGVAAAVFGDVLVLGEDGDRLRSGSRGGGGLLWAGDGLSDDPHVMNRAVRDIRRAGCNGNQFGAGGSTGGGHFGCGSHLSPCLNLGIVLRSPLVQVVNLLGKVLAGGSGLSTALSGIGVIVHAGHGALHGVDLVKVDGNVGVFDVAVAAVAEGGIVCILLAAGILALGRGEGLGDISLGAKDARAGLDAANVLPARSGKSGLRDGGGGQEATEKGDFGHSAGNSLYGVYWVKRVCGQRIVGRYEVFVGSAKIGRRYDNSLSEMYCTEDWPV